MTITYFEVDLTVEIAFGYGPTDTPVWTDVSDYVRGYTVDRGRRDEFGSYSPGTASVTLSNTDRRFDPEHASGAYFGELLPMVPLRIVATYATVDYPVFYGFVQGWPQQYVNNIDSTVTVRCIDAFRLLEQATLAESAYRYEVDADAPVAYYPFTGGALVDEVAANDLQVTYPFHAWQANDVDWLPVAGVEATTEGGGLLAQLGAPSFLSAAPLAIEFVFVLDPSDPNYDTAQWNIVARAGSSTGDQLTAFVEPDGIYHLASNTAKNLQDTGGFNARYIFQAGVVYHVVASWDSDDYVRTYINGEFVSETLLTNAGTSTTGRPPRVEAHTGQTVAHFAIYDAPMSAARVAAHYDAGMFAFGGELVEYPDARIGRVLDEIGWPSGTRDVSTGGVELGPYLPAERQALDYIREVETTEQGLFYVGADGDVVFRDRAWQFTRTSSATFGTGGLGFFDVVPDGNTVDVVRNQVKVIYNGSDSNVTVEDATSISAYGYMSESLSTPQIQTIGPARGLASFRVRVGKDPRSRVSSLVVKPRSDPANLFPAVLGVELGDVVTVTFTPVGVGSASTYVTSVQGIQHSVGRGEFDVELYLAPAVSESGPYFQIGDATFGRIGAAYGNKLSY